MLLCLYLYGVHGMNGSSGTLSQEIIVCDDMIMEWLCLGENEYSTYCEFEKTSLEAKILGNKRLEYIHMRAGEKKENQAGNILTHPSWTRNPVLTIIKIHPMSNSNKYQEIKKNVMVV